MNIGDVVVYDGKSCIVANVVGPAEGNQVCVSYAGAFTWVNPSVLRKGEVDGRGSGGASEEGSGTPSQEPIASDEPAGDERVTEVGRGRRR